MTVQLFEQDKPLQPVPRLTFTPKYDQKLREICDHVDPSNFSPAFVTNEDIDKMVGAMGLANLMIERKQDEAAATYSRVLEKEDWSSDMGYGSTAV